MASRKRAAAMSHVGYESASITEQPIVVIKMIIIVTSTVERAVAGTTGRIG